MSESDFRKPKKGVKIELEPISPEEQLEILKEAMDALRQVAVRYDLKPELREEKEKSYIRLVLYVPMPLFKELKHPSTFNKAKETQL